MSEHDEQPPMTRRERRLRELAETGALDLSEALQQAKAPAETPEEIASTEVGAGQVDGASEDVEISPFNEDGTPRSRREMRQLREAALAARAESVEATPVEADPVEAAPVEESGNETFEEADRSSTEPESSEARVEAPEVDSLAESVSEEPVLEEPAAETVADGPDTGPATEAAIVDGLFETAKNASEAPETSALDFDSLMAPPTAPFSVEEIREAERPHLEAAGAAEPEAEAESEPPVAPEAEVEEPVKPKRRFPWKRNKSAAVQEQDADSDSGEPEEAPASPEPAEPVSEPAEAAAELDEPAAEPASEVAAEPVPDAIAVEPIPAEPETEHADALPQPVPGRRRDAARPEETHSEEPESASESDDANDSQKYSFPDIQPPEEWRSVFDDPASRTVGGQGASDKGDFDDLISRAVAQEGAAGTSNTSALILPSMPDDTGGLSGPLGATGELYITGSIELPRSLGETGGHSSLHDSLQMEPIVMPESGEAAGATEQGPMPVSAKHAVSARMPSGMPVVAKPTKEKSKLPLVLTLSGGGLLIVIVGLGVWGATNGMFSG